MPAPLAPSTLDLDNADKPADDDDEAVGAAFLGINSNIVKTAREPKPPEDYVDSAIDVLAAADKKKKEQIKPQAAIRKGPVIAVGGHKDEDQKQSQSDDQNKKKK
eukprot:1081076_1